MKKNNEKLKEEHSPKDRFNRRIEHVSATLVSKLARIDELKGQWTIGAQLSPLTLGRLKRSVLITSTGASTRIEGAMLSDSDIEKLMRGIDIQRFADRDKQEVKGYYELLGNIFNSWIKLRLNESTIKHFHKELLKYVEKDQLHRGEYKKRENKVQMINEAGQSIGILFDTTSAFLVPKEMLDLVSWTQDVIKEKKYHPLLVIGNFLVEFLKIHPFQDGNGRLSRILTNLLLLQAGYLYMPYVSHEKLVEDNKPDYYLALRRSQKTLGSEKEDISAWLEFFCSIVLKQSQTAINLFSKESIEKILSKQQLVVWEYLKKVKEAGTGEIVRETPIPRGTVKQALEVLLRLKRIERIGLGRSTRYREI